MHHFLRAFLFAAGFVTSGWADELAVFPPGSGPAGMLERYLKIQAYAALDRRVADYEKIKTVEQIAAWQKARRGFLLQQLGDFPERTPLNAQVTGSLDRGDYRIEKVIFESQPQHHVTALLYLPKSKPPYPGVLVPCGHSANGKAAEAYQRVCILLAQNGLAALCYDPIGQGERAQILKPDGKAAFSSTQEHTLVGIGSILLGSNTAQHRIWDGIRALDYLASRPEVDPLRLGCTGNSGGGTLTSYLMALDERIVAAAPACYPTTFRELLEAAGPQDAEQNIFGQIAFGLDIPDYTLMRAPKPTLLNAATRDGTFTIAGAWTLFREAKRIYTRFGLAERVDLVEADAPHEFSTHLRVGAVRWMRRWLLKIDDAITERLDSPVLTDNEARCSPQGQVMLLPGERSDFHLNSALDSALVHQRQEFWKRPDSGAALDQIRNTIGARTLAQLSPPNIVTTGSMQRYGCRVEKLLIETAPGLKVAALLFIPPQPDGDAFLCLSDQGKVTEAATGARIEALLRQNHLVLAIDLPGTGETQNGSPKWYGGMFGPAAGEFYLSYLMGQSLVGLWTEQTLICGRFLAEYSKETPRKVHLVGAGSTGVAALHAAVLEPTLFHSLELRRTLPSWSELVRTPAAPAHLITAVHGALKIYDLPDLIAAFGKERVKIEEPAVLNGPVKTTP